MSDKDKPEGFTVSVQKAECGHWKATALGIVGAAVTPSGALAVWAKNLQTAGELALG